MSGIPKAALFLGLAGTLPFCWAALVTLMPALEPWGMAVFGMAFAMPQLAIAYGIVILCFMSGVLWGFATKAQGMAAPLGYGLSVVPALFTFFFITPNAENAIMLLIAGFAGLLVFDGFYQIQGLAPRWWLKLRVLITAIVCGALFVTQLLAGDVL